MKNCVAVDSEIDSDGAIISGCIVFGVYKNWVAADSENINEKLCRCPFRNRQRWCNHFLLYCFLCLQKLSRCWLRKHQWNCFLGWCLDLSAHILTVNSEIIDENWVFINPGIVNEINFTGDTWNCQRTYSTIDIEIIDENWVVVDSGIVNAISFTADAGNR
jgi:hypothetical protein